MSAEIHRPSDLQLGRIAYRRGQAIRSVLLAALSTAVLGTLLGVLITGAPGWARVKQSFFDWPIAREYLPEILEGLWLNIRLFVVCAVCALALGLVLDKDSVLTGCVSTAVDQLRQDGTLAVLEKTWLADTAGAPELL